jgi:hypothetical protein
MNPSLSDLSVLIGHWDAQFDFPTDPPGALAGRVEFHLIAEGAFLVMRSLPAKGGPPKSVSIIGRDEISSAYTMLYYDERGVSRVYVMNFGNSLWTLEGRPRDFWQRFRAEVGTEIIRGAWEASADGQEWTHDFAVTYTRRS